MVKQRDMQDTVEEGVCWRDWVALRDLPSNPSLNLINLHRSTKTSPAVRLNEVNCQKQPGKAAIPKKKKTWLKWNKRSALISMSNIY